MLEQLFAKGSSTTDFLLIMIILLTITVTVIGFVVSWDRRHD